MSLSKTDKLARQDADASLSESEVLADWKAAETKGAASAVSSVVAALFPADSLPALRAAKYEDYQAWLVAVGSELEYLFTVLAAIQDTPLVPDESLELTGRLGEQLPDPSLWQEAQQLMLVLEETLPMLRRALPAMHGLLNRAHGLAYNSGERGEAWNLPTADKWGQAVPATEVDDSSQLLSMLEQARLKAAADESLDALGSIPVSGQAKSNAVDPLEVMHEATQQASELPSFRASKPAPRAVAESIPEPTPTPAPYLTPAQLAHLNRKLNQ